MLTVIQRLADESVVVRDDDDGAMFVWGYSTCVQVRRRTMSLTEHCAIPYSCARRA